MFKFRHINGTVEHNFDKTFRSEEEKSKLQTLFDSYLAIASNLPFLIVFVLSFSKTLKRYCRYLSFLYRSLTF